MNYGQHVLKSYLSLHSGKNIVSRNDVSFIDYMFTLIKEIWLTTVVWKASTRYYHLQL